MGKHLCVCITDEGVAPVDEFLLEGSIIFYDAVVDERDVSVTGQMGVCVDIVGHTVRSPACVANADGAAGILSAHQ